MPSDDLIYFNGVNATRGVYARAPLTAGQLAALIKGDQPSAAQIEPDAGQRALLEARTTGAGSFRPKEGVREDSLAATGWAVVFPAQADYSAVREALTPLLQLRRSQAGALYRECFGPTGYRPAETARDFLKRQGAATSGVVDPVRFPYYVLLVGSPEEISFRFQYQLDVQYAVGRLHLPTLAAYDSYARSVLAVEQGAVRVPRRAVFFAPSNPDDRATATSSSQLAVPLAASIAAEERAKDWQIETVIGAAATKSRLSALLGGAETPALLFTASHGAEFDPTDSRQVAHQGALICQDWPGPQAWTQRALTPDCYFAGDDIGDDARLLGTVAFHFACFGAGTPRLDDFAHLRSAQEPIAPHSFVSGLSQRLLGHPKGGALAVVGHVERAWTYSFSEGQGNRSLETFASFLRRVLLAGAPVGWALEFFNERYAELATGLTANMESLRYHEAVDDAQMSAHWTEHNDARSYVVLGDPAVRLPLPQGVAAPQTVRATIPEVRSVTASPASAAPAAAPVTAPADPAPALVAAPVTPTAAPFGGVPAPLAAPPVAAPHGYGPPPSVVINYNYGPPPSQPDPVTPPAVTPVDAETSFGLRELLSGSAEAAGETVQTLADTLRSFAEKMTETLQATLQDVADLQVATYVADDLTTVDFRTGDFSNAELRAFTRMELGGDTQVLVPRSDLGVDQELWAIHMAMVAQAQTNRAEMFKAIAQVASGLLTAVTK